MWKRGLSLAFLFVLILTISAPWAISAPDEGGIPAYHAGPPPKGEKLPPILTKDQLWGNNAEYPFQTHAYELAAKIPNLIYQEPCYCYCERMGHKSLHSCFEGNHAAHCDVCMKEAVYAYQQTKLKKTPAQIRAGIIAGKWKTVDLENATM